MGLHAPNPTTPPPLPTDPHPQQEQPPQPLLYEPHKGNLELPPHAARCRPCEGSACGAGGAGLLRPPGQAEAAGAVQGLVQAGHGQHALVELHAARRQGQAAASCRACGVGGRDALQAAINLSVPGRTLGRSDCSGGPLRGSQMAAAGAGLRNGLGWLTQHRA